MSVINQMLKDLDRRSAMRPDANQLMTDYYQSLDLKHSIKKRILFAALLSAGLILAVDIYVVMGHLGVLSSSSEKTLAPFLTISSSDKVSKLVNFEPTTTSLTGLTLQTQNQTTLLQLILSAEALYRINHNPDSDVITITLEHVQLSKPLTPIDFSQSAFSTIQVLPLSDGSLKIILYPKPGSTLQQAGYDASHTIFQVNYLQPISNKIPTKKVIVPPMRADEISQKVIQLMTQRNFTDAAKILQKGSQIYPDEIQFVFLKAKLLIEEGHNQQALFLLEQHAPVLEQHADYYAFLAALYQRENRFRMAAKLYQRLLEFEPYHATWWVGLGVALDAMNKHKEALRAYYQAEQGNGLTPTLSAFIDAQLHPI
ncbi:MAG: tetratricopeptide repeat protein [Gammaproteobacteria bacterium]|nr:tetratricopeptide repeat protein [Gammaproteobacteria bacterium]